MGSRYQLRLHLSGDFEGDLEGLCNSLSTAARWSSDGGRFVAGRRHALFVSYPAGETYALPLIARPLDGRERRASTAEIECMIRPFLCRGRVTVEASRTIDAGCQLHEYVTVQRFGRTYHLLKECWPGHRRARRHR